MATRLSAELFRLSLSCSSISSTLRPNPFISSVRHLRVASRALDSIRDNHRQGTKLDQAQQEVFDGTTGAASNIAVNTNQLFERFPTPETLKKDFYGTPYCELPIVYVKATKNNTLVTVTDYKNQMITYTSCRLEGFKNARKKTTIAGQTTGVAAGQRLVRRGIRTVRVQVKGLGPGRMTCVKGLTVAGVEVVSITDHTPLAELGPRPRKIRRI